MPRSAAVGLGLLALKSEFFSSVSFHFAMLESPENQDCVPENVKKYQCSYKDEEENHRNVGSTSLWVSTCTSR